MTPLRWLATFAAALAACGSQAQVQESAASLLHREDVQTELRLTDKQRELWAKLDPLPKTVQSRTFEDDPLTIEDPAILRGRDVRREQKAWTLLSPGQTLRLMELLTQRNGVFVLLRPDFRSSLELSDAQIEDVLRARSSYDQKVMGLLNKLKRVKTEASRLDPKKVRDSLARAGTELRDQLERALDDPQRVKLSSLGGKPFKFLEKSWGR